jgi:hypothetical protein
MRCFIRIPEARDLSHRGGHRETLVSRQQQDHRRADGLERRLLVLVEERRLRDREERQHDQPDRPDSVGRGDHQEERRPGVALACAADGRRLADAWQ